MTVITKEAYEAAVKAEAAARDTINAYHRQRLEAFDRRMIENPIFTDDELVYAAVLLCPCGHGLAYPKDCGPGHYWDCSAILKGIANPDVEHSGRLPFAFYSVKSENDRNGTTRGVIRPKPAEVGG